MLAGTRDAALQAQLFAGRAVYVVAEKALPAGVQGVAEVGVLRVGLILPEGAVPP